MSMISVCGDSYNIRREGNFYSYPESKWKLLDLGVDQTLIILPFSISNRDVEFIFDLFGMAKDESATKQEVYIAVPHRIDDEIVSTLEKI